MNGVISSIDVNLSKKLFLFIPDSDDLVTQPLNAWKNRRARDLSDTKLPAILLIVMNSKFILGYQLTKISNRYYDYVAVNCLYHYTNVFC